MRFVTLLFSIAVAVSLVGSADAQWPLKMTNLPKPAASGLGITGTGRFQVFVSPSIKGATFMIDTDTGRIWIFKKDHSTGDYSLDRVTVEEVDTSVGKQGKTGQPAGRENKPGKGR